MYLVLNSYNNPKTIKSLPYCTVRKLRCKDLRSLTKVNFKKLTTHCRNANSYLPNSQIFASQHDFIPLSYHNTSSSRVNDFMKKKSGFFHNVLFYYDKPLALCICIIYTNIQLVFIQKYFLKNCYYTHLTRKGLINKSQKQF